MKPCWLGLALWLLPLALPAQRPGAPRITVLATDAAAPWDELTGLVPLRDAVALVFAGERTLRIFDSTGTQRAVLGRPGGGPGEYDRISAAGRIDDDLWVYDRGNARIQVSDATGDAVRTFRAAGFRHAVGDPMAGATVALRSLYAVTAGDSLVVEIAERMAGSQVTTTAIHLSAADGTLGRKIALVPPDPCARAVTVEGMPGSVFVPFCVAPRFVVSPGGTHAVQMALHASPAPEYCLRRFMIATVRVTEECFAYRPRTIPRRVMDSAVDARRQRAPEPLRAAFANLDPLPTAFPVVDQILLANDGTVWARDGVPSVDHRVWWRHMPGRRAVDHVTLPADLTVLAVGADRLWASRLTADGHQEIVAITLGGVE